MVLVKPLIFVHKEQLKPDKNRVNIHLPYF